MPVADLVVDGSSYNAFLTVSFHNSVLTRPMSYSRKSLRRAPQKIKLTHENLDIVLVAVEQ